MGVVWLGRHELLRTEVAVKFILPGHAGPNMDRQERERFLDGARAAANIRHPGLTRVLYADIVRGIPYLVMEHISGRTIAKVQTERGGFDCRSALCLVDAAAETIAHLHLQGVVHGDIKPSNLLLDRTGVLYVTDFGLACRAGASPKFIAGTPAYMAPEMFDGRLDPRTDVYAIGVMCYELLTGRLPFDGDRDELRMNHRFAPLPRGPLRCAGVPEAVIGLIHRATNRNPLFRIKSASRLLELMRHELHHLYNRLQGREVLFELARRQEPQMRNRSGTSGLNRPHTGASQSMTLQPAARRTSSDASILPTTSFAHAALHKRLNRVNRLALDREDSTQSQSVWHQVMTLLRTPIW